MGNKRQNKVVGNAGESIAARYLERKGHVVLERNYRRPWSEIDIITRYQEKIHFVEVKTVSYETKQDLKRSVSHGTWRPEEQVHAYKIKKIYKGVESWLQEKEYDGLFQIDVVAIRYVPRETYATVRHIENIVGST